MAQPAPAQPAPAAQPQPTPAPAPRLVHRKPTPQPAPQLAPEPAPQPVPEPVPEPASEPAPEPAAPGAVPQATPTALEVRESENEDKDEDEDEDEEEDTTLPAKDFEMMRRENIAKLREFRMELDARFGPGPFLLPAVREKNAKKRKQKEVARDHVQCSEPRNTQSQMCLLDMPASASSTTPAPTLSTMPPPALSAAPAALSTAPAPILSTTPTSAVGSGSETRAISSTLSFLDANILLIPTDAPEWVKAGLPYLWESSEDITWHALLVEWLVLEAKMVYGTKVKSLLQACTA